LFAVSLLATLILSGATSRLDNAIYDFSLPLLRHAPRHDIVIVAVDAPSIGREGDWPWPRSRQAKLIDAIAAQHPRALGWYFLALFPTVAAEDDAMHTAMSRLPTFMPAPPEKFAQRPGLNPMRSALAGSGPSEAEGDRDGIVRRAQLSSAVDGAKPPHLALQLAALAPPDAAARAAAVGRRMGARPMLIPFLGRPGAFPRVRASDLLDGHVEAGALAGKFVLVGATAPGLLDSYPTPVSKGDGMPEVEVNANILDALLSGRYIIAASPTQVLIVFTALLTLMLWSLIRLGPTASLWFGGAMMAGPVALCIAAVPVLHLWVTPAPYLVTLALILPYWGWRRLNAASSYFAAELKALESDAGMALVSREGAIDRIGGDVVLQQMTLLEEAKRRISDLRQFVDDMLANFPDPVLVANTEGLILTSNAAAKAFSRATGACVDPGSAILPVLAQISGDAVAWPPGSTEQAFRGPGPQGRIYELRFTATHDAGERATGWIVHLADITALVSAMRGREEALQLLSHDMRSPQAAIIALLNHPEFVEAPQTMRGRIEAQARRTLEMADAFVRLAKAEAARYDFEPVDLAFIVQDATESVWSLAQSGGVKIRTEAEAVEFLVLADRGLMSRALVNILDNAVKFSPAGTQIVCRLRAGELGGAPAVVCEIADQAGGMDQDELNDVFTKFASGRDAVSGSPGIGLGLALVRTVVTRHNGVVSCESRRGEGTTFRIVLPTIDEAEAERIERELALA
jgi:CHASE2 domain-containing sensor protein